MSYECLNLFLGYFCNVSGLSEYSGPCEEGYYCVGGSKDSRPVRQTYGDKCPAGYYCPEASPSPTPCPSGKNHDSSSLENKHQLIKL